MHSTRGMDEDAPVSILARPEGRALPQKKSNPFNTSCLFQSSPGPKAGRCPQSWPTAPLPDYRFNPRPARRPGAAADSNGSVLWIMLFQSSPGPKAGRCLRGGVSSERHATGFNPRPARRPGAAARTAARQKSAELSFQSSPGPKAGRCLRHRPDPTADIWFQSSPGPKAGRCRETRSLRRCRRSFNPRPARRPGAASSG